MIEVKLSMINLDSVQEQMRNLKDNQLPFAISLAVNRSAKDVRKRIIDSMPTIFNKPVPFTLDSLGMWPGNKSKPSATVGFKEWAGKGVPAVKYLQAQVYGGIRRQKKYEVALQSRGIITGNQVTVPDTAFRDNFGNVKRGEIVRMLSSLSLFTEQGYSANKVKGKAPTEFFAWKRDGSHMTIYKRIGKSRGKNKKRDIVPFLHVIDMPNYPILFEFDKMALNIFSEVYLRNFEDAINYAIETSNK
jgi:hypothetical protein